MPYMFVYSPTIIRSGDVFLIEVPSFSNDFNLCQVDIKLSGTYGFWKLKLQLKKKIKKIWGARVQ